MDQVLPFTSFWSRMATQALLSSAATWLEHFSSEPGRLPSWSHSLRAARGGYRGPQGGAQTSPRGEMGLFLGVQTDARPFLLLSSHPGVLLLAWTLTEAPVLVGLKLLSWKPSITPSLNSCRSVVLRLCECGFCDLSSLSVNQIVT